MSKQKLGPTGEFPDGRIADDDDGEIGVGISADRKHGLVNICFGAPVIWTALKPAEARAFAAGLIACADELEAGQSQAGRPS